MTFASSPLSLKLLLILFFLKALIDTAVWINGAAHINIFFAVASLIILTWFLRAENKQNALISILLITFYRAFLNIVIILPTLGIIFSSNRFGVFNILIFLLPAIVATFVLLDWEKISLETNKSFSEVIDTKNWHLYLFIVPTLFPIFLYHSGLFSIVIITIVPLIIVLNVILLALKFNLIGLKTAISLPLISWTLNYLFFDDFAVSQTSIVFLIQKFTIFLPPF